MHSRWRSWVCGVGLVGAVAGVSVLSVAARAGGGSDAAPARSNESAARVLEIYPNSPVVVRAGESVELPVQVVCADASGSPCPATATLGVRTGAGSGWHETRAEAVHGLRFDLSAPAARAAADGGRLSFSLRADGPQRSVVSLPAAGRASSLDIFVTRSMAVVRAPSIPFGQTRAGSTALFLPWGSGPLRAGLVPGRESATIGPSSFDVDANGRIHLADPAQGRIGVFAAGRLVSEARLPLGSRADVALAQDGSVYVLDDTGSAISVRRVDPAGAVSAAVSIPGIPGQVRTLGTDGLVDVMPADQWVRVTRDGADELAVTSASTGRPLASGERLLRVVRDDRLRLATVSEGTIVDAVEIVFDLRAGEVALAEPDGSGGYWAVVHLSRSAPTAADQFEVLHVVDGRIAEAFAVADSRFADTPPLGRFRLGRDGHLYQLTTSPRGLRIVRFDLGGES